MPRKLASPSFFGKAVPSFAPRGMGGAFGVGLGVRFPSLPPLERDGGSALVLLFGQSHGQPRPRSTPASKPGGPGWGSGGVLRRSGVRPKRRPVYGEAAPRGAQRGVGRGSWTRTPGFESLASPQGVNNPVIPVAVETPFWLPSELDSARKSAPRRPGSPTAFFLGNGERLVARLRVRARIPVWSRHVLNSPVEHRTVGGGAKTP